MVRICNWVVSVCLGSMTSDLFRSLDLSFLICEMGSHSNSYFNSVFGSASQHYL
jgi:hypothetical protein